MKVRQSEWIETFSLIMSLDCSSHLMNELVLPITQITSKRIVLSTYTVDLMEERISQTVDVLSDDLLWWKNTLDYNEKSIQ